MKVFIVVKVPRGDLEREKIASILAAEVRRAGFEPFVAFQELIEREIDSPAEFMPFVRRHIRQSGLALVAYHPELRGGLIEMGIAFEAGIPIWLLHKTGERISSSARGCADRLIEYQSLEDLVRILPAEFEMIDLHNA